MNATARARRKARQLQRQNQDIRTILGLRSVNSKRNAKTGKAHIGFVVNRKFERGGRIDGRLVGPTWSVNERQRSE